MLLSMTVTRPVHRMVLGLAVAGLVAAGVPAPAQAAAPRGLRCGDIVTRNRTLTADLTCSSGNGLVIGADGITVNLNGHTITGSFSGKRGFPNVGILANKRQGVRITGPGLVRRFDVGVQLQFMKHSVAENLSVRRNDFGLLMHGEADNLVFGVTATRNVHGGIGVSGDSTVSGSTISDNGAPGVVVSPQASVLGNVISGNGPTAMQLVFADNSLVAGNRISGGDIEILGNENQILRNRMSRGGIVVENGFDNVLDGNVIDRAGTGISVEFREREFTETLDTVVRNNVVTRSAREGIFVGGMRGSRVTGNRVSGSGADGIDAGEPESKLTRNRARSNAGYGIFAEPGVKDGGHNHASGNGQPAQCAGVRCRP